MERIFLPLVILVIFFIGAGYYIINNQNSSGPTPLPQGKVCEPDSLVCQDGTILKRELPGCSFPPCPSADAAALKEITLKGTTICLPQRDTSEPQTLECALGIEAEDGNNYALYDPGWRFLVGIGTGTKVSLEGKLIKSKNNKYESAGVIEILNLRAL